MRLPSEVLAGTCAVLNDVLDGGWFTPTTDGRRLKGYIDGKVYLSAAECRLLVAHLICAAEVMEKKR